MLAEAFFLVDLSPLKPSEVIHPGLSPEIFLQCVYCMVWCLVTLVAQLWRPVAALRRPFWRQLITNLSPGNHQPSLFVLVQLDLTYLVTSRSAEILYDKNCEKILQGGRKKGS